jgi:hypothetical protein
MKLNNFNEAYEEHIHTDEYYLEEGLKFFKKSSRLYKYAERVNDKLIKAEKKGKISKTEIGTLKKLSKDIISLADEYKVIEDDFVKGNTKKEVAKSKVKSVNLKNETLVSKLKKDEVKGIFKKVGLGALVIGISALLVQLGAPQKLLSLIAPATRTVATGFTKAGPQ